MKHLFYLLFICLFSGSMAFANDGLGTSAQSGNERGYQDMVTLQQLISEHNTVQNRSEQVVQKKQKMGFFKKISMGLSMKKRIKDVNTTHKTMMEEWAKWVIIGLICWLIGSVLWFGVWSLGWLVTLLGTIFIIYGLLILLGVV